VVAEYYPLIVCSTSFVLRASSSLKPHEAMDMANSQFPLCCMEAARNEARRCVEVRLASTWALSSSTPGQSQKGCLVGKMSGTAPNFIIIIINDYSDYTGIVIMTIVMLNTKKIIVGVL